MEILSFPSIPRQAFPLHAVPMQLTGHMAILVLGAAAITKHVKLRSPKIEEQQTKKVNGE